MVSITVPELFKSDGCTLPGPLKILKGILGSDSYRIYCREHDFLRRYGIIHWFKANVLLARRIAGVNLLGAIRSPFYLLFTTVSYPFYNNTQQLPSEWEEYAELYR